LFFSAINLLTFCSWFSYVFTYTGPNQGLLGFMDAITLVMETGFAVTGFLALFLNLILPEEIEDEGELPEDTANILDEAKDEAEWDRITRGNPSVARGMSVSGRGGSVSGRAGSVSGRKSVDAGLPPHTDSNAASDVEKSEHPEVVPPPAPVVHDKAIEEKQY
jgi:hypothetical protein